MADSSAYSGTPDIGALGVQLVLSDPPAAMPQRLETGVVHLASATGADPASMPDATRGSSGGSAPLDAAPMGGMLGRDHALLGAVGFLAAAPTAYHLAGVATPGPAALAVGALVCSGFSLLPDIDEPGSTISRKLGPISHVVSVVTRKLAGGHRQATHSLAFAAAVGFGCWGALRWRPATAATVIVVAATLLVARLVVPLGLGRILGVGLVLAAAAGWWTWSHPLPWLPVVAAAGVVAHLIGDAITVEGVPFLWPVRWRVALPIVGHTSSTRETILGTALSIGLVALIWVRLAAPALHAVHLPKLT